LKQTWRSKILSENWDAQVVFTTAVQVLEALFGSGTRAVRRMHQMVSSVIIFDEIQTLPVRCVHIFNNAVNFLVEQCGSTAVLCTATQPLLQRVDARKGALRPAGNAQLMPDTASLFSALKRHEIHDRRRPGGWAHTDAANFVATEARSSGSCLVVVNTKAEARSIFQACKEAADVPVSHLSTGMCPAHRLDVLATIKHRLEQRAPVICVSTQLIEAGVDISFGSCIRALAGIDSIAQAAGRCNRHGESLIGHVHVINLAGELPRALSEIRAGQQAAERVLDENKGGGPIEISDPRVIEQYFRYYFFARQEEMDYPLPSDRAGGEDTLLRLLSHNDLAVERHKARHKAPPRIWMRQSFRTAADAFQAIDASTQGVIVPYQSEGKELINRLCAAREPSKQFETLRLAQRFSVNVFPQVFKKLQQAGALHEVQQGTGILYLEEKYYSNEFGLNADGNEEVEAQFA
jgi:CRISPR-associated endonuclease/helicase Cas3